MDFNENEVDIIRQCKVDDSIQELLIDTRKGVPQSRYVFGVHADSKYDDFENGKLDLPVPVHLHGYWMTDFPTDLRYINFFDALPAHDWVKCEPKEVVTIEWVEI